ncbi:Alpha/Beta hydrolase protein [Trichoderma ceciliae]
MRGPNPELIQPEDWARPDKPSYNTPVFLIHDGGGTTFAYHCLEILGRYIYGIRNPYFYTGDVFEGGLPEMAYLYATWIRETVLEEGFPARRRNGDGSTSVMLGGWSLGGLLSMEIARQLAEDKVVRVVGILMIDSVYPGKSLSSGSIPLVATSGFPFRRRFSEAKVAEATIRAIKLDEDVSSEDDTSSDDASTDGDGLTSNQMLSKRCMAEAVRMVRQWRLPEWTGRVYNRRPRVVLLRAKEYVPTKEGRVVGLDLNREDRMLGWGDYDEEMFSDVFDIDGHHFDIFAFDRIDAISRSIRKGLDRLEECSQMMMFGEGW